MDGKRFISFQGTARKGIICSDSYESAGGVAVVDITLDDDNSFEEGVPLTDLKLEGLKRTMSLAVHMEEIRDKDEKETLRRMQSRVAQKSPMLNRKKNSCIGSHEDANPKWRDSMEDAQVVLDLDGTGTAMFIGVYDGHGGRMLADFCAEHLHQNLLHLVHNDLEGKEPAQLLSQAFSMTDEQAASDESCVTSGCTAVCVLMSEGESDGAFVLTVANAGDARAVLGRDHGALRLSRDHKPTDDDETERICAAGGFVSDGRVNGAIGTSRAFGDFDFKKPGNFGLTCITAEPHTKRHSLATPLQPPRLAASTVFQEDARKAAPVLAVGLANQRETLKHSLIFLIDQACRFVSFFVTTCIAFVSKYTITCCVGSQPKTMAS